MNQHPDKCFHHPNRNAFRYCEDCKNPICQECKYIFEDSMGIGKLFTAVFNKVDHRWSRSYLVCHKCFYNRKIEQKKPIYGIALMLFFTLPLSVILIIISIISYGSSNFSDTNIIIQLGILTYIVVVVILGFYYLLFYAPKKRKEYREKRDIFVTN